jgi:hypothetical protein
MRSKIDIKAQRNPAVTNKKPFLFNRKGFYIQKTDYFVSAGFVVAAA